MPTTSTKEEILARSTFFIGTQGDGPGEGIHAAVLDEANGQLELLGLASEVRRPTWLLWDGRRRILYSVSELGNAGDRHGELIGFACDDRAALREIGRTGSGGGGPTHLALHPDGATLFAANFGGQAAAIPVGSDGTLSIVRSVQPNEGSGPHRRQQGPHPHGVTVDPSGRFLLVPDMGADRVFVSRWDADRQLLEAAATPYARLPAGSGPRLLLFGADGRFDYLLTELSAEVFVFAWDAAEGRLGLLQQVALDEPDFAGDRSAAAFTMSGDGRFLYASNRATARIHVFRIDAVTGRIEEIQQIDARGAKPWHAEVSATGRWLIVANQGSDEIALFRRNPDDGRLESAPASLAISKPTCIAFAEATDLCAGNA